VRRDEEEPGHRLRFALSLVAVALVAGITASAAWSALIVVRYVGQPGVAEIVQPATTEPDGGFSYTHSSEVNAMTGQYSENTCGSCPVRVFIKPPNYPPICDNESPTGWALCAFAPPGQPGHTIYSRAFCRNPHTTSARWFHCWKFREDQS
jgi:hypothetical protein